MNLETSLAYQGLSQVKNDYQPFRMYYSSKDVGVEVYISVLYFFVSLLSLYMLYSSVVFGIDLTICRLVTVLFPGADFPSFDSQDVLGRCRFS